MQEKSLLTENSGQNTSLIKPHAIGLLLISFLAVKLLIALVLPVNRATLASDLSIDNILQAVNAQRSLRNLITLNTNDKLGFAAQSKSDDMQTRHYFAHVDPDGHYIWDKITAAGYTPYLELGENLAIEFYDTDSLISAWMNSPTHRANLLNDGFKDQGMGLTFGNTALNQYHSAIANTFGTLAPAPKPKTPAAPKEPVSAPVAAPKPPVVQVPKPKTLGNEQKSTSTPQQNSIPTTTPEIIPSTTPSTTAPTTTAETTPVVLPEPVLPRENLAINQNPNSNFSLPSQPAATTSTTSLPVLTPNQPEATVVGQQNNSALANYQTNRYLILFAGFILLMLMLSDIKKHIQNKFQHLDKKFNNLIVLLISLAVVAFMYWL